MRTYKTDLVDDAAALDDPFGAHDDQIYFLHNVPESRRL